MAVFVETAIARNIAYYPYAMLATAIFTAVAEQSYLETSVIFFSLRFRQEDKPSKHFSNSP